MIDAKRLLEQMLGGGMAGGGRDLGDRLTRMASQKGFASGAVTGGLLGALLGGKRMRGGLRGLGGAAVLGALALRALHDYQRRQGGGTQWGGRSDDSSALPHSKPAADGSPFELALVRAMVGAAKADGHVDETEQRKLLAEIERMDLDTEAKAYVLDLLSRDVDAASLADAVATPEQAVELYLAARLAIDVDNPAEREYLDTLARRLDLPQELREGLNRAPEENTP